MAFGKRSGLAARLSEPHRRVIDLAGLSNAVRAVFADGATRGRSVTGRKQIIGTALVGILLGFGGVTAGTTLVHASERSGLFGFFDQIFNPQPRQRVVYEPRRAPKRYSSLPGARRVTATQPRHYTPRPVLLGSVERPFGRRGRGMMRAESVRAAFHGPVGTQTVCVRTCDGYIFPLGHLRAQGDLPVHKAACAAACPNAQTALFTLPPGQSELEQAVSLKGQPYVAAAWANVYRQKRVENCSCQPPGVAAAALPIGLDSTIRVGDIVGTEDGADVVTKLDRGRVLVADYRGARGLSRRVRGEIDGRVGAIRRDSDEARFRRALRVAEAAKDRTRLAEAGAVRLRAMETAPGFTEASRASGEEQAFTPVRVVAHWLYDR